MNELQKLLAYKKLREDAKLKGFFYDADITDDEIDKQIELAKETIVEADEEPEEEPKEVVEADEKPDEEPEVKNVVEEEPVKKKKSKGAFWSVPEVKTVAMALEEFKKEKTQAQGRFTKASNIAQKYGTDGGIVLAVTDLQKSITAITDKFLRDIEKKGEASTSALEVSFAKVSIQDEAPQTIKKKIVKKKLAGAM
jgi:hypothetical protein